MSIEHTKITITEKGIFWVLINELHDRIGCSCNAADSGRQCCLQNNHIKNVIWHIVKHCEMPELFKCPECNQLFMATNDSRICCGGECEEKLISRNRAERELADGRA